jgi:DNA-binding PadR family transcriptional regulator
LLRSGDSASLSQEDQLRSTRLMMVCQILAKHGPMTAEAIVREMLKLGHDVSVHETLRGKVSSLMISLWRLEKAGLVAREGKGHSALWRFKASQTQPPQSQAS